MYSIAIIDTMSQQESGNQENGMKQKEEAERKFGCPCGKWYLSYPALFTHVKQKHDGKPPGQLIKPKTDKARGRPRLPINTPEEDQSVINFNCGDELEKLLQNITTSYQGTFQYSTGKQSCQDMASQFLKVLYKEGEQNPTVLCFINYLKFLVRSKNDQGFWENEKPNDIIDLSNELVRELENYKEEYPIQKNTLIELLFILFKWMYKMKWTDHKLVKRGMEDNKENIRS